jgi:glyoxylase-like metal-dependent hydrolase (beta-lactamase superfamily II)
LIDDKERTPLAKSSGEGVDSRPRLHLIDLDQELPGQRRFISCWVSVQENLAFIVDPGPPSTVDHLIAGLEGLGVARLDFILLTHVHLDHAGCTAGILTRWPDAKVVCHEKGRPHLVDPTRLWAGSRQVLGRKAEVYGEPAPVPAQALADVDELAARGVETIPTPGHAAHHVSFRHGGHLFLGEAAGTFSDLGAGPATADFYLRPATPPRFIHQVARASLDRLLALDPLPDRLLFAHHGDYQGDTRTLLKTARDQLNLWVLTVADTLAVQRGLAHSEQPPDEEGLFDLLAARLAQVDSHYVRVSLLPADIQERERDFTRQTLRGILEYLAGQPSSGL